MKAHFTSIAAIALAALFATGTAVAKSEGKDEQKAEKHERKAEKHERKAEKHERKEERKAQRREDDIRVGGYFDDRHREHARRYYSDYYRDRRCPPGLAKKNNGCMPPGQAKKWNVGEPLPRSVVVYEVPRPVLVQLPPAPYGYRYARVGGDILLVRISNNLVIDIIVNVFG